jgi:ligand-binding sensor domain-containing protein
MLRHSLKRRIQLLLMYLVAALVLGQRAAADSPFTVDAWSTEDGLPQSSVIALTETRDGYLWLGTLNGLVRFDGNSVTPFNVNNTPGLPDNGIVFLFEDRQTNLWIGTQNGGLCALQNGMVTNFDAGNIGGKITFADEDESGEIWFWTSAGKFISAKDGKLNTHPALLSGQTFIR